MSTLLEMLALSEKIIRQKIILKDKASIAGCWFFIMTMLSAASSFSLESKAKFSKTGAFLSTITIISIINIVTFFYTSKEKDSNIRRLCDSLEVGIAASITGEILQGLIRFSVWSLSKTKNMSASVIIDTLGKYSL